MPIDRRWYWLGAALAAAVIALVAGIPLRTLLYVTALLACPAAMFFGMGMMGGTQNHEQGAPPGPAFADRPQAGDACPVTQGESPIMILKRRLAADDITVEEYE